ncbi:NAD(P)-binding protein [Colletotrichum zoysiae]|uniref:NAD(P)-binding protein n=1 Tax=Colletotrichum zoysiae TaxID=1216348 RepID=A0AAD9HG20_9PEZI|nr:NAD(P)-binding protein [Colletotrichum zoysiae]
MASPVYTVLVTGSSGHLGAALMLTLPSRGHTPLGLDILPSETTTVVGSVTDRALVASLLARHPSIVHIVHAAALHKPHVGSHPQSAFVDTNITGTLVLLEEAAAATVATPAAGDDGPGKGRESPSRIRSFVYVSTTSAFGAALAPAPGLPAAWIDESVAPVPKNIYGVTKRAAEDLCALAHRGGGGLPVVVLRAARFFPEADDDPDRRASLAAADDDDDDGANLKVCELAYRRADIADVASAVACAMEKAAAVGFGTYIISAPPPFSLIVGSEDLGRSLGEGDAGLGGQGFREGLGEGLGGQGFGSAAVTAAATAAAAAKRSSGSSSSSSVSRRTLLGRLDADAGAVFREAVPGCAAVFEALGWGFLGRVDRVYDPSRAVRELGWAPEWTFEKVIARLARGEGWRSELAHTVGKRGYHAAPTGVYTTR